MPSEHHYVLTNHYLKSFIPHAIPHGSLSSAQMICLSTFYFPLIVNNAENEIVYNLT